MRCKYVLIIVTIIFFMIGTMWVWVKMNNAPPAYDEAAYLERSLEIYYASQKGPIELFKSIFSFDNYKDSFNPHRALVPLTTMPFYMIFGKTMDIGVMTNAIFMVVLLCTTYVMASRMFCNKVGILSLFVVSTFPLICSLSRLYMPEIATTAMVTLSLFFLICSEAFQNRYYSIFFGFTMGLGMLTRENYIVGIIGPLIYTIFTGGTLKKKEFTVNLITAIVIGGLIAFLWYIPNIHYVWNVISRYAFAKRMAEMYKFPTTYNLDFLGFYLFTTFFFGISWFYSVIFMGVLPRLIRLGFLPRPKNLITEPRNNHILFLALWVIVPYLILTLAWDKDPIYFIISYPAIAILISVGVIDIRSQWFRKMALSSIIIIGLLQFTAYSFDIGWLSKKATDYMSGMPKTIPAIFFGMPKDSHPCKDNWQIESILHYITEKRTGSSGNKKSMINVVPDCPRFSWSNFSYYIALHKLPFKIKKGDPQFRETIEYENILDGCDYIIIKTGEQGEGDWDRDFMKDYSGRIIRQLQDTKRFYGLDKNFALPDGSIARVYARL